MTVFPVQSSYSNAEVVAFANGAYGEDLPRLPLPPMLLLDRVNSISESGGTFDKGMAIGEMDINPDLWFFKCHFKGDPVMPGCLMLDGFWQLTGFYLGWRNARGKGRATKATIDLKSEVLPTAKTLQYVVNIERLVLNRKMAAANASGQILIDGVVAAEVSEVQVLIRP